MQKIGCFRDCTLYLLITFLKLVPFEQSLTCIWALWTIGGVRVGFSSCWNKLALCKSLKNLHASFRDLSAQCGRKDGHGYLLRSSDESKIRLYSTSNGYN